jgi:hypothetical protein
MSPEGLRAGMTRATSTAPHWGRGARQLFSTGVPLRSPGTGALVARRQVDDNLLWYMEDHGITAAWETPGPGCRRHRGTPGGEHVIRRAWRMASAGQGESARRACPPCSPIRADGSRGSSACRLIWCVFDGGNPQRYRRWRPKWCKRRHGELTSPGGFSTASESRCGASAKSAAAVSYDNAINPGSRVVRQSGIPEGE